MRLKLGMEACWGCHSRLRQLSSFSSYTCLMKVGCRVCCLQYLSASDAVKVVVY